MTQYEILTLALACIAVFVSLVVWNGQRKMQREANDMQRATAELAKKQLEILLREEKGKSTARLSLDLFRDGKAHRFRITNVGEVAAKDVEMELLVQQPKDNPIIASEYAEKFGSSSFRVEFARKWLAAWAEIMMPLKAQYLSGAIYLSVLAMRRGLPPGELVFSLYLQPS